MFRKLTIQLDRSRTDLRIRRALRTPKWLCSGSTKILIVSAEGRISTSQFFPFYYYAHRFDELCGIEFRQVNVADIDTNSVEIPKNADLIFIQPWFNVYDTGKIVGLINLLKLRNPIAKVVFFDAFAPLDLRFAHAVNPFVDAYVKKHVFRDRSRYGVATQGHTNLMEYYERLYDLPASPETLFPIPHGFLSKLFVGPSFFTSREMLTSIRSGNTPLSRNKKWNVHARLGGKGSPWYQTMREHALDSCRAFGSTGIVTFQSVSNTRYMSELAQSRICFSPFGYGEVCWRDYEAVMSGALLFKPEMSHVQTNPDIFVPYETYVPVAWDFSDLSDKLDYYLANDVARQRIVNQAYETLHTYANCDGFVDQFKAVMNQVA